MTGILVQKIKTKNMKPSLSEKTTFPFLKEKTTQKCVFNLEENSNICNHFLIHFFISHHILLVSLNTTMRCNRSLTKNLIEEKNRIFLCSTAVLLVNKFIWTHNAHSKLFWWTKNTRKFHLFIKMCYVIHGSHFKHHRRHSCLAIITMILKV